MKSIFYKISVLLILLFASVLFFQNCSKKMSVQNLFQSTEADVAKVNLNKFNNSDKETYFPFGYFANGATGNGTGNYLNETSLRSNIHFITMAEETDQSMFDKLEIVKNNNQRAIMLPQHLFYSWSGENLVVPYTNAEERFVKVFKSIEKYKEYILGYYLFDEPYWANDLNKEFIQPNSVIYNGLQTSGSIIKKYHSEAKVILTVAFTELQLDIQIPDIVDWFGMNCYLTYGSDCSEENLIIYFQKLEGLRKPHQKLVLTLDAYSKTAPTNETQIDLIRRVKFWFQMTKNSEVAAYFPFIYQNFETNYGAETHPILLNYLDQIYTFISEHPKATHQQISEFALLESGQKNSCSANWKDIGQFSCHDNLKFQKICSCLPPGYNSPEYWNADEATGCYSHMTGEKCYGDCPADIKNIGDFQCLNGEEHQKICHCKPASADNPLYWVNEGNSCYSHRTGVACDYTCPDPLEKLGQFTCVNGKEYQRICNCKPRGYNDPNLWITESNGCFSHTTGNSCQ